jgi:DNA repair protein RecO (recombination protein O)
MSIEKSVHLVLAVMPYRETSAIVTLLSHRFGRVSGIARGVRRKPRAPLVLERGQLVELVLYVKPHRDLHTIGSISVVNYYPGIRSSLGRFALRDAAFELILRSMSASETHGDLFEYAVAFLDRLECTPVSPFPIETLWHFFSGWAVLHGFSLNFETCVRCADSRVATEGGVLATDRGGLVCCACSGAHAAACASFLPGPVVLLLRGEGLAPALPGSEQRRVTRLLAGYCRYHLDIRAEFKTLDFLESVDLFNV